MADAEGRGERWVPPGAMLGHYAVQRFLAAGSMAQVYLAVDEKLARPVALKVFRFSGEARELMLAEARLTARFNHPHIVTVYDADAQGDFTWLALEYLPGETLRARLETGPFPLMEALRVVRSIADALVEAHRLNVIHADLKPENVLLPEDGRLRVLDFGLARLGNDVRASSAGSPSYMAPERWKGGAPTPAVDAWSLGVMLYELLTGTRPVADERLGEFVSRPAPIQWPAALLALPVSAVLARSLDPDPASRPTAREMLDALTSATQGEARGDRHPFRGLQSFAESDAPDLVGRELDIDHALESLRRQGFALVAGRSGLGKSSLLAAGLTPRLRETGATCVTFRPGAEPVRRLALALDLKPQAVAQLEAAPRSAALFALRLPRRVILIDQLEEAFTLAAPTERATFFEALRALLDARACRVVLAIRDDHLGLLAAALTPQVVTGMLLLQPLGREALAQAILRPLRRVGASVDQPALVERLVREVAESSVALPLLQFVCQLLWDGRDRQAAQLRLADYEALGGASGALAAHGERVLQVLRPDERQTARALVLRLVTAEGSRAPCREATLLEVVPGSAPVIARLVEERLLVATRDSGDDSPQVELAHEALIAVWPSLRRWLDETQEDRTLRDDIEQGAARWARQFEREDDTWSGATLLIALKRQSERPLGLSQLGTRFLEAGRARDSAAKRRSRWRLTSLFAGLAFVAVAGIVATTVSLSQRREIKLAASNSGEFQLKLRPFRLAADGSQVAVEPGSVGPISWSLSPAPISRNASHDALTPYPPEVLERRELGALAWQVRAPAAPALLRVKLEHCPASALRLEGLPGYEKSQRAQVLEVPVPVCDAGNRVVIPAGPFISSNDRVVELPAFDIDTFEVTGARFDAWARLSALTGEDPVPRPPFARDDPQKPMVGVTAVQAEAFCRYLGRRLPTSDEWLKAARGGVVFPDGGLNPEPARHHPWGDAAEPGAANWARGDAFDMLAPVGGLPRDVSPLGVFDLGGNVTEWTATPAVSEEFQGLRIVRGGNWDTAAEDPDGQIDFANTRPPLAVDYGVGFRCAATIDAGT